MILAVVVAGARMATASLPACPSGGEANCADYTSQPDCDTATTYQTDNYTNDTYTCGWYNSSGTQVCDMQDPCDPQANPAPPSPGPPGNPAPPSPGPPVDPATCEGFFCCSYDEDRGHVVCSTKLQENCGSRYCKSTSDIINPGFYEKLQLTNEGTDECNAGGNYKVVVKESRGKHELSRCCTDSSGTDCYGSELSNLADKPAEDLSEDESILLCRASSGCRTCLSTIPELSTYVLSESNDGRQCEDFDVDTCGRYYFRTDDDDPKNYKCVVKDGKCQQDNKECTSAATATQSSTLLVAISVAVIAYELIKE